MLGGAGVLALYGVAVLFMLHGAPDLALTQLIVEVVTLVLLLLGLRWLPPRYKSVDDKVVPLQTRLRAQTRRLRDLVLALVAGASLSALSYAVLTRQAGEGISNFFLENSLPLGGGSNVVNVILVDFRGFDTLGEISVVMAAGMAVVALLRTRRRKNVPVTSGEGEP